MDLSACAPGTPGLNPDWQTAGVCPRFRTDLPDEIAPPDVWAVLPETVVRDGSFRELFTAEPETPAGPWTARNGLLVSADTACANLGSDPAAPQVAFQKLGPVPALTNSVSRGFLLGGRARGAAWSGQGVAPRSVRGSRLGLLGRTDGGAEMGRNYGLGLNTAGRSARAGPAKAVR